MLIDEVTIIIKAGDGGNGAVAFNKVKLSRGPTGADGGNGGNVYFEGTGDINALMVFASRKEIEAERGRDGRGQFLDGRKGEDFILKVPIGTRVTNLETNFAQEIEEVGQRILAAGGGIGGRGNFKFRSATNTTPMEHEDGTKGDVATYKIELRLIAGVILADIPGIIEGASSGKGLGVKFLKHIERTKVLFHLIDAESEDVVHDYKIIRNELETYNPELTKKTEHVLLTKTDAVTPAEVKEKLAALKKAGIKALPLSVLEPERLEAVKKILNKIRDEKGL